jgi:hypothetical protein
VIPRAVIMMADAVGLAEEIGMNKLIWVAVVALALLAQSAPINAATNTRLHAAGAQKEKPTPAPRSTYVSCRRYFPLIGAIVSVPCTG